MGVFFFKSTRIGFKPAFIIENAVEQYDIAGIITSEFLGKSKLFNATVNASVPLLHPIAYLALQNLAKFFSNSSTAFPFIKSVFLKDEHYELEEELLAFREDGNMTKDTLDALRWATDDMYKPRVEKNKKGE